MWEAGSTRATVDRCPMSEGRYPMSEFCNCWSGVSLDSPANGADGRRRGGCG